MLMWSRDESLEARNKLSGKLRQAAAAAVSAPALHPRKVAPAGAAPSRPEAGAVFHNDFAFAIGLAQCFGMFPVQGCREPDPTCVRYGNCSPAGAHLERAWGFRWLSLRVLQSLVVVCCALVMLGFTLAMNFIEGFTFERSSGVAFYGAGFLTNAAFLQLATRWPQVSRRWREADAALADYGRPRGLHARLRLTAASLMCFALVEHVLANITNLVTSVTCSSGGFDWLRRYCERAYPQVFSLVAYDHGRCLVFWATNVIDTFAWNFMDLFVMLLSMVLAARFHQLNSRLHALRGKMLTQNEWRRLREDYDTLCQLTRDVDSSVCNIVLLSCANNLYFICLQLFNSLKKTVKTLHLVYFYVSFAVLLGRTIAVLFLAARVNDQSKGPLPVLFQVPSDSYCVEVERLMDQVIWDEVAFTGLKFFSITRKLILTVAGTIATYEVVLLQLNDVNSFSRTEQQSLNSTEPVC
ncbi:gustatory receptor for sugar taste 64a-like [Schistocerca serialis cubense]|uniref:gustatory receptor for sugar taste 64a-like n=1 Tax=Schistocerca serialis cubense TaxID=2023355 RepID=UPI00214F3D0E|nr:gustatory receptor for sugar taste 64a-like [Schistocerca serialis cubense]